MLISGDALRKEFQGNKAVQANVFSFVDHTHSAATKFLDNSVVRNGLADDGFGLGHFVLILGRGLETVKGMWGHRQWRALVAPFIREGRLRYAICLISGPMKRIRTYCH